MLTEIITNKKFLLKKIFTVSKTFWNFFRAFIPIMLHEKIHYLPSPPLEYYVTVEWYLRPELQWSNKKLLKSLQNFIKNYFEIEWNSYKLRGKKNYKSTLLLILNVFVFLLCYTTALLWLRKGYFITQTTSVFNKGQKNSVFGSKPQV